MIILGFDKSDVRLIFNMWRMTLADRYLGSALGGAWALLNPLLLFALFTFVFGFVFKARLPGADSTLDYSIWLICGYGPWLANTEALSAASNSIVSNSGIVKNMSFKTEVLPISATLLGLVPLCVSLVFLLTLQIVNDFSISISILWLPIVILVQFLFLSALGIMFSVITTFIRDFNIVLPNLLMIGLFATPIFYPVEAVPSIIRNLTAFNPIYIISSAYRTVLLEQNSPQILPIVFLGLFAWGLLVFNLLIFRRIKGYFPAVV